MRVQEFEGMFVPVLRKVQDFVHVEVPIFWLGELAEFAPTEKMFTRPEKELTEAYLTGKMG